MKQGKLGRINITKLFLLVCLLIVSTGISSSVRAGSHEYFANVSNKGPLSEADCNRNSGRDVFGNEYDYLIKAVPKNGVQVGSFGNVRSLNGKVYVIYGVRKGVFLSTTSISICEFDS